MTVADYKIKEIDPFVANSQIIFHRRETSPYANRIRLMWHATREKVIENFPIVPTHLINSQNYLAEVEENFVTDAYHSLSIEVYRVSYELIEHVRSGDWKPEQSSISQQPLDAMAKQLFWMHLGN
jgi:hypothetical protein